MQALIQSAEVLMQNEEHQLAQKVLKKLLSLVPNNCLVLKYFAQNCAHLGEWSRASNAYRLLIQTDTNKNEHYIALSHLYYKQKRYNEALTWFNKTLKQPGLQRDNLYDVFKSMGYIHLQQKNYPLALKQYYQAYILKPRTQALVILLGLLEMKLKHNKKAGRWFHEAFFLNENNELLWMALATLQGRLGDFELALASTRRALDISPTHPVAQKLLTSCLF